MKFFSKLFGNKKKDAQSIQTTDAKYIDIFMSRSELWDLKFTPEVIQIGLDQCKAQAAIDDAHYKLPEHYGALVMYQAEKGNAESKAFLQRSLEHGATEEDFTRWWNSEDIMRRMMEWELKMRKHKRFQEFQAADPAMGDRTAILQVQKLLPEFGEPNEFFGEGKLDKYLPVELQFKVDKIIRGLSTDERMVIAQRETSFNAYLYKLLMPERYDSSHTTDQLSQLAEQALEVFQQGRIEEAHQLAINFKEKGEEEWGRKGALFVSWMYHLVPIFHAQGEYVTNEEVLSDYLQLFDLKPEQYLRALTSLGQTYVELGNIKKAVTTQKKAYEYNTIELKNSPLLPRVLNNYALALSHDQQYQKAIPYYEDAIEKAVVQFGEDSELHALYLSNLSMAYLLNQQYKKGVVICQKSITIRKKYAAENPLALTEGLEILAGIYQLQGNPAEALKLTKQVFSIREQYLPEEHPDYATSLGNLAVLYHAENQLNEALIALRKVVGLRQLQMRIVFPQLSEKEKEHYYETIKFDFDHYTAFLTTYMQKFSDQLGELMNMRLMTKGALLIASQNVEQQVIKSGDQVLMGLYGEIAAKRRIVANFYESALYQLDPTNTQKFEQELETLEKEFQRKSSRYKWSRGADKNWQAIQQQLGSKELAIEVIRTYQTSHELLYGAVQYAFLLISATTALPECVMIPNGEQLETEYLELYQLSIHQQYDEKRAMLQDEDDEDDFEEVAQGELYAAFWGAIVPKLKRYEKIYFSPDGVYHQVNVQTLFNADAGRFLIDEWEIHTVGNLSDLLKEKKTAENKVEQSAYLVGAPNYLAGMSNSNHEMPKIPYLSGAKKEVEELAELLKGEQWMVKVLMDDEATEEAVIADLYGDSPRVVHISTHGFFQKGDPAKKKRPLINIPFEKIKENPLLQSGLLLAGAETAMKQWNLGTRDGILTAFEVLNLTLNNTELVTLSACETGLGKNKSGEGVYGLQRAFQLAGAANVLMSLWKVPDSATQELMIVFYQYWLEIGDKRKAFRKAQQTIKAKYPEAFYWGAFVMIGN